MLRQQAEHVSFFGMNGWYDLDQSWTFDLKWSYQIVIMHLRACEGHGNGQRVISGGVGGGGGRALSRLGLEDARPAGLVGLTVIVRLYLHHIKLLACLSGQRWCSRICLAITTGML